MKIDLTPVFQSIIALLAALVTYKLVPWIRSKVTEQQFDNLNAAARVAVYAAEQIFKSGDNSKKLDFALDQLMRQGFDLDVDTVRSAVEKAVYDMKTENRIAQAYEKRSEKEEEGEDDEDEDFHIPPVEDWPLEMIITFCDDNGIPHDGCETKADYIRAIVSGGEADEQPSATEDPEE